MDITSKFIIYLLIVAGGFGYPLSKPIYPNAVLNIAEKEASNGKHIRQVVQPTWLTNEDSGVLDERVHVTKENLEEAAEIRKAIQTAVHDGTYVVQDASSEPHHSKQEIITPQNPPPTPAQWSFQYSDSLFSPLGPFQQGQQISPQNAFMDELQRIWLEFLKNSQSSWSWYFRG